MSTKKSTRLNAKKRRNQQPVPPIWTKPPHYLAQPVRNWRVRFDVSANAAAQTLSTVQLAAALGIIATAATTSVFLSDSFRLKKTSLWSWTSTPGTTADVMLKYVDSGNGAAQGGPPCLAMDSSASADTPAYVTLVPPKTSMFNLWHDCNTALSTTFMSYLCTNQGILDFEFEFIVDDVGVTAAGPTIAGATLGTIYHKSAATLLAVTPLNRI
jgi:hypothetical protein